MVAPACVKAVSAAASRGQTVSSTDSVPSSRLQFHNAWVIHWNESDRAALSPAPPLPPTTTCSRPSMSTWVPGQKAGNWDCQREETGFGISPSLARFLIIGIPLIVAALVAACCTCCFMRYNLEKRIRMEEARQG
jgi:hypothetical protein